MGPTPKKSKTSTRGKLKNRSFVNHFRRSSSASEQRRKKLPSGKGSKSARPVLLMAALVAAVAVAGLVYWGKSSKPAPASAPVAAAGNRNHPPEKVFDHRESPKPREAARPQARERNKELHSSVPTEKRTSEHHAPQKPEQPAISNTSAPPSGNHYASLPPEHHSSESPKAVPPPKPPAPPLTPPIATVAIVIDDFGGDLNIAKRFIELPIPVTLSILPYQRYSREIADLAHAHHRQVILHLPMEPKGYPKVNPGKGALLMSMSAGNVERSLNAALEFSPYFTGLNNHMGSRFTEHAALMKTVLEEAQKRGLYFIDSYTSPRSAASSVAQQVHIPFRRRDIFLDNNQSEKAIREQIKQLIRRARIQGSALAIGHPRESTLRALNQEAEEFVREEIAVVPAGELVTVF